MYKVSDFMVGQIVYVELINDASRNKKGDELIEEWVITNVGRKYVTAVKKDCSYGYKFMETDANYGGLIEKSNYSPDYVLYPSKKAIQEKLEYKELYNNISWEFSDYCNRNKYTLEQLRKIKEILGE